MPVILRREMLLVLLYKWAWRVRRSSADRMIRSSTPPMEVNSLKTCMNSESSSSYGSQSSIFSRMWVASLLVLSLEEDETSSVSFSSENIDQNILGGY